MDNFNGCQKIPILQILRHKLARIDNLMYFTLYIFISIDNPQITHILVALK